MTLLTGSKEVHYTTSAVPIGHKHKYESSPADSAGTGVGLSISLPELLHFSDLTFEDSSQLFSYILRNKMCQISNRLLSMAFPPNLLQKTCPYVRTVVTFPSI